MIPKQTVMLDITHSCHSPTTNFATLHAGDRDSNLQLPRHAECEFENPLVVRRRLAKRKNGKHCQHSQGIAGFSSGMQSFEQLTTTAKARTLIWTGRDNHYLIRSSPRRYSMLVSVYSKPTAGANLESRTNSDTHPHPQYPAALCTLCNHKYRKLVKASSVTTPGTVCWECVATFHTNNL